jgi:two-component system cell cycle sensor histidine kinase/response regulator CckA
MAGASASNEQQYLAKILDSIADPVVAFDREWRFTYISRRAAEVLGKSTEEMLGRSAWDLFPADPESGFQEACRRAWIAMEPVTIERYSKVLGIWIESYIYPFEDGASVQWRDITGRRWAEEALRESEAQFRTLANAIPQLCWMAHADGSTFWFNQRWYDYTGSTFEQMQGWGWQAVHDPLVLPRVLAEWKASLATGRPLDIVFPLRGADGSYRPFLTRAMPVRDSNNAIVRWFGANTDIGEQLRTEQQLAEAVQRLNAHMDNSPLAVVEFDPEFRIIRWSDEAERLFGWRRDEILGRGMHDVQLIHPDDIDSVKQVSRAMLTGSRPRNLNVNRNLRKDGAVLECEWYNSAIYDGGGQLASILSQVLNVTERRRTEERLRRAQKLESVALLAGGVAHDFNNLLTGIVGNSSLAADMLPKDSPAQELLDRVLKSGEQAAHLTKQLLGYAGKGRFVLETVDLSGVVGDVTDLVRSTAPKKIAIDLELQPGLPAIVADRGQIHQVLMNLVINATEAIGDNPGTILVRTGMQRVESGFVGEFSGTEIGPGEFVFLEVCDTGAGMPESVKARIFDPFFTTKEQGRGLGLAAVGGIVRGHRGAIRVSSVPGRGTSFLLLLPPAPVAAARTPAAGSTRGAERLPIDRAVLVVDDEEMVRSVVARGLERCGCDVRTASSGPEAIEFLGRDPTAVQIVILDLSMPGMSGHEVLPKLLALNPSLDVFLTSGYAQADALRLFEGMRVAGFIQKPFTIQRFLKTLGAALQSKQS